MAKGLNRFPKSSRLHLRKEISEIFNTGKSIQASPLKAVYKILNDPGEPVQVGVAVPKRNVKLAVNRNRIKRQIKEAYRLNSQQTVDYFQKKGKRVQVMVLYSGKVSPQYAVIESKIILILQRLQKLADE
ncbi:MAG: ribonuclease P protein component [Bacteroidetes bacterium]|nr:ribonuclease P protein component [Bacteroidota bacterium]